MLRTDVEVETLAAYLELVLEGVGPTHLAEGLPGDAMSAVLDVVEMSGPHAALIRHLRTRRVPRLEQASPPAPARGSRTVGRRRTENTRGRGRRAQLDGGDPQVVQPTIAGITWAANSRRSTAGISLQSRSRRMPRRSPVATAHHRGQPVSSPSSAP